MFSSISPSSGLGITGIFVLICRRIPPGDPTYGTHVMCRTPRSYVLLLQLLIWVSWPALSLNIPQLPSLNHTELMDSSPLTFCTISHTFNLLHPVQSDCEAAINRLLSVPGPTFFYTNPPVDSFKLPTLKAYGTCLVSVNIFGGPTVVKASWPEIRAKAGELNQVCVPPTRELSLLQGGTTYAGEGDGIVISLLRSFPEVNSGNRMFDVTLS